MIRLAKPNIDERSIARVAEVLRSGNLVQGENVSAFENELENYLRIKHVIVVSSGTAALHLSLLSLGIGAGDEVIVPSFTFPATVNTVELVGATPRFVDISLNDFCIDVTKIEKAINNRTRAIMPVHEFGYPAAMGQISAIAKEHDLKIIEDAACALGSEYRGGKVGTFGNAGCFSFHPRKAITTGEGGAIATNDSRIASHVKALRNHGLQYKSGKSFFEYAGFNYRMTDFQAVLGISQLIDYESQIQERINLADFYNRHLEDVSWIKTPSVLSGNKMIYQTYHIMVNNNIDRENLIQYLYDRKIETNFGAHTVPLQEYYNDKYGFIMQDNLNAYYAGARGLALPIGPHISTNECLLVIDALKGYM